MIEKCPECGIDKFWCTRHSKADKVDKPRMDDGFFSMVENSLIQCHSKISLYNEADKRYLGGVEATTLLNNIEALLDALREKRKQCR